MSVVREIRIHTFGLTPEEHDALFDRVADAAHALNEEVICGTSLEDVNEFVLCGDRYPKTGLDNETAKGYRKCVRKPGHVGLHFDGLLTHWAWMVDT